ncbi:DUF4268 domain-containing protein [Chloroflexota bacterium]
MKMATWAEDIIQALKNFNGQATLTQIYAETIRLRRQPLPKRWKHIIQDTIYQHSSDTKKYQGKDYFHKVGTGVWALRENIKQQSTLQSRNKPMKNIIQNIPDSYEQVLNILKTIKQYREYQDPGSSSWNDYIMEIFHILGFSTKEVSPRLFTLNKLGINQSPIAIVGRIQTTENFEEIVPGLKWLSHLFFAAQYYQVPWGILTNGQQLKIVNLTLNESQQQAYWPDFDEIICSEKMDSFFNVYKEFSIIKPSINGDGINKKENVKKELDESHKARHKLRLEFWDQLILKAKTRTNIIGKRSPDNWIEVRSGKSGLHYSYVIRLRDKANIELYIDRGEAEINKEIYNFFLKNKDEIEKGFGEQLDWQILLNRRASRINFPIITSGILDKENWPELQDQMIEAMIRFERALRPFIHQIN